MTFDLTGKNVVYVGGFSGIGFQTCRMIMKKKITNLVICSRMENVEMLQQLQTEVTTVKVHFVHMNIVDRANIEHAVKQIAGMVSSIDVLVNGVGVLADKDVETTIDVNLTGLINTTLAFLPFMDKTINGRGGIVVNISSVYGLEPAPAFAVYSAAKHGVVGFTRSLGNEFYYRKTGIACICACPGLTTSELMTNLRDKVTWGHHSEELADVVEKAKKQTPEECAVNIIKAIEMMKNGGIFLCNLGQLKEVVPTVYWHL